MSVRGSVISELTSAGPSPSPTAFRYTGLNIIALRSGTNELPCRGVLSGALVAEVVPVDPVVPAVRLKLAELYPPRSGVTFTASVFGCPGWTHGVTLSSCAAYMPTICLPLATRWPFSQISPR